MIIQQTICVVHALVFFFLDYRTAVLEKLRFYLLSRRGNNSEFIFFALVGLQFFCHTMFCQRFFGFVCTVLKSYDIYKQFSCYLWYTTWYKVYSNSQDICQVLTPRAANEPIRLYLLSFIVCQLTMNRQLLSREVSLMPKWPCPEIL